jgi:hypothetical protein
MRLPTFFNPSNSCRSPWDVPTTVSLFLIDPWGTFDWISFACAVPRSRGVELAFGNEEAEDVDCCVPHACSAAIATGKEGICWVNHSVRLLFFEDALGFSLLEDARFLI